jgi:hypothetical protein
LNADSVNDTKIKLRNNQPLRALDAAGTGVVELIKAGRNEANDTDVTVLPDETRLDTDAEPTEDTHIPNKKYVDNQIDVTVGSGVMAPLDFAADANKASVTLPNGLIIKRGTGGVSATNTITFADTSAAFPTACLTVSLTLVKTGATSSGGYPPLLASKSDTNFVYALNNAAAATSVDWIAIGY